MPRYSTRHPIVSGHSTGLADDLRGEARAQQHPDDGDHDRAHRSGHVEPDATERCHGRRDHRAEHPRKGQVQPRKQSAAGRCRRSACGPAVSRAALVPDLQTCGIRTTSFEPIAGCRPCRGRSRRSVGLCYSHPGSGMSLIVRDRLPRSPAVISNPAGK